MHLSSTINQTINHQKEILALRPGLFILAFIFIPPMFTFAFMPPPIPTPFIFISVFLPFIPTFMLVFIPFMPTFMLVFMPFMPTLAFMPIPPLQFMLVFIPIPPISVLISMLGPFMLTFIFIPLPQLALAVVIWQLPPTGCMGCMQMGEGILLLMMMVFPLRPPAAPPPDRSRLHSITALGAQQMLPQQRQLQPNPSHAHMWQHSGSINLRSSGLQHHQEQMRLASWQPPQQTPQQLYHQQSQMRH